MSNADTHKWEIDASKPSEKILGCNYWGNNHIETLALFSKDFIFLDAERWGPRETYYKKEKRSYNTKLGIQGELTPAYIVNAISYNEQIGVNELKHPSLIKSTELYENLNAWMSDIMNLPLKAKVAELDESRIQLSYNIEGGKGTSYSALQVGFGLTFCLPIVVAVLCAKKGDLIIVENPEAHLHPAAQSRLGGLLAMVAKYGVQVIIETHSEHIINGVRLAVLKKAIEPNEVVINFFSTNIDGGIFKPSHGNIRIQQDGELTEWPVHFFDQAELDFIELLRLKAGK
jgi:predicted ATPase